MTLELTADLQARLDAHLDSVEAALDAARHSREQRRAIVDDLETQILDMLAARSDAPALADLEAVLATLDPPAAYAGAPAALPANSLSPTPKNPQPPPASPPAPARYSRVAIAGLICILLSLLPLPLILAIGMFVSLPAPQPVMSVQPILSTEQGAAPGPVHYATTPSFFYRKLLLILPCGAALLALALVGTLFGWISLFQIRKSKGLLRGRGMALFDGLFYPILTATLLCVGLIHDLAP